MADLNVKGQIDFSSLGGGAKQVLLDFCYPVRSYFITESENFNTVAKVIAHFGGN